jgi:hypothetical protein
MAVLIPNPGEGEVLSVILSSTQSFLARYEEKHDFADCIVAEDQTWVFHYTPETKWQ